MVSFEYTITDPMGIHARPAGIMVKRLKPLPVSVSIDCCGRTADGKRLFAVMNMAVKCGETVTVIVEGEGEEAISADLFEFFKENY